MVGNPENPLRYIGAAMGFALRKPSFTPRNYSVPIVVWTLPPYTHQINDWRIWGVHFNATVKGWAPSKCPSQRKTSTVLSHQGIGFPREQTCLPPLDFLYTDQPSPDTHPGIGSKTT